MLLTLAAFILVLGVLIFVHELGHFMAAKAVGIGVPRFSIGFGPATPLRFRRGETEYLLSWIPFGGYVKMASLEEQQAMEGLEGGSVEQEFPPEKLLESKSLAARILVISAGVIMNALFAWAAYTGLLLVYGQAVDEPRIGILSPGAPAEAAGMMADDLITHINGEPLASWGDLVTKVEPKAGQTLTFTVDRQGETVELEAAPAEEDFVDPISGENRKVGRIGVGPQLNSRRDPLGFGSAVVEGARQTGDSAVQILAFLKGMVLGQVSPKNLGGPILIGQASGQFARAGIVALVTFMAFLSMNLAILNLLPIPVLDGGHLVFLIIEGLRGGKPLPLHLRLRLTQVGMYLLLGLMLFAVINDVLRIIG